MLPPESMAGLAESAEGAVEEARPACAGRGNAEKPVLAMPPLREPLVFPAAEDATASACEPELGRA